MVRLLLIGFLEFIKKNANRRKISFLLSKEEFKKLVKQNCFYCNEPPSNCSTEKKVFGEFIYNGIDRVDNTKGYILDNCVPCCKICNTAKNNLSNLEFESWVKRLNFTQTWGKFEKESIEFWAIN